MIIYLDILFLLNLDLDFILLMSISIILKRNVKIRRIIIGSLFGSLTTFILFIKINTWELLFLKIILGFFMCIITFGYKSMKYTLNNYYYLIVNSIILGGGLYLIKDYGYYNYYVLIISFIIIMFIYLKQVKKYQNNYSNYYKVKVLFNNSTYYFNGYLDTGNKLYDNYHKRPVILTSKRIKYDDEDVIYVACKTINGVSMIKCLKPDKVIINGRQYNNYLIGIVKNKFLIDGVDCILHSSLKGELG